MTVEPRFVLNRNEGQDVIHLNPGERCNTDDSKGREVIDPDTAEALLNHGDAVRCLHCYPEDAP